MTDTHATTNAADAANNVRLSHSRAQALNEAGSNVIRAANTLALVLAGEFPLTKNTVEHALRRYVDARNAWYLVATPERDQ